MTVKVEQTPNPNAFKFSVGSPVGGPGTYVKGSEPDEEFLAELLALDGVASVFFTADFVTITTRRIVGRHYTRGVGDPREPLRQLTPQRLHRPRIEWPAGRCLRPSDPV